MLDRHRNTNKESTFVIFEFASKEGSNVNHKLVTNNRESRKEVGGLAD